MGAFSDSLLHFIRDLLHSRFPVFDKRPRPVFILVAEIVQRRIGLVRRYLNGRRVLGQGVEWNMRVMFSIRRVSRDLRKAGRCKGENWDKLELHCSGERSDRKA